MNYAPIWAKTLNEGEIIEQEFSVGRWYRYLGLGLWIFLAVLVAVLTSVVINAFFENAAGAAVATGLLLGAFVFGAALFYFNFYVPVANAYAFTNKRVLIHRGWLSTHAIGIDYEKITDVLVSSPLIDRLLTGTGHLVINTAGTDEYEILLRHVEYPYELKKRLDALKETYLHAHPHAFSH